MVGFVVGLLRLEYTGIYSIRRHQLCLHRHTTEPLKMVQNLLCFHIKKRQFATLYLVRICRILRRHKNKGVA